MRFRVLPGLVGGLLTIGCAPASVDQPAADPSGMVDHHVHILSPTLVADWKTLGVPFSRPDSVYTSAPPACSKGTAPRWARRSPGTDGAPLRRGRLPRGDEAVTGG